MAHLFRGEEAHAPEALKEKIRNSRPRDGDRDDAEVIFVGMEHVKDDAEILCVRVISSSKPVISNILNRVTKDSHSRRKKGHVGQGPACTLQPANRVTLTSKAVAVSSASLSEWREIDSHTGSEPLSKPDCHNSSLPGMLPESSDLLSPWPHCLHGAAHPTGGKDESPHDLKRLSASDGNINSGNPKRLKLGDGFPGAHSSAVALPGLSPTKNRSTASEGVPTPSSHAQGGPSFPWAHATDKAHFNLIDPDGACSLEKLEKTDFSSQSSQNETVDPKKGSLIVLLDDFYYGQHTGDGQPEQKTHTTFKCPSCLKVLKNVKFMTHMRNHLELEKQRCDGWEIHTTCQHCHRQSPTPFLLQCHIESVHTAQEPSVVCKICELSFETDQVLLQHMKDNHKPGEMPYECPVCSYRSSAFADVEAHFRTCHENTKNLLCLFCLRIFKVVTSYVNHSWRHWNKRVYRCSKCRLQFLTFKEKTEHQTKNHQPVKKPEQLEGLPPETEVVIQTSVQPGSRRAASIVVSNTDPQLSPAKAEKEMTTNRRYSRRIAARALAEN
uniref:Zinc finger protein 280A n=1 Tax=Camelus bactrianus TaxID=9837 RepID=A0A9W3GP00_CAMBA|nr:zinc finger protein 280A [Camelus bactrianus]